MAEYGPGEIEEDSGFRHLDAGFRTGEVVGGRESHSGSPANLSPSLNGSATDGWMSKAAQVPLIVKPG